MPALEPEVIESQVPVVTGLEAQTRGEIDIQIATAKRYPRSVTKAIADAMSLATLSEEIAESCFYAKPQDGKTVEGPSARLAEIVASCWGHMRSEARVVEEAEKHIVSRGTSWDLERNVAVAFEVRRSILKRDKSRFSSDMVVTASNAANSIAYRNSVFRVIPRAFWWPVYLKAREVAVGKAETLANNRDKALGYFLKMGATNDRVFAALGVRGIDDITLEQLAVMKGFASAIRDGETTVDEVFPSIAKEPQRKSETAPPVAPVDAAAVPISPTPAAAVSTSPAASPDQVWTGVRVLDTKWVEDSSGGYAEITTNKGVMMTRDKPRYEEAATAEGSDTLLKATYRFGKRMARGKEERVVLLMKLELDEPEQGTLPTEGA
jgi:hypothetical protein